MAFIVTIPGGKRVLVSTVVNFRYKAISLPPPLNLSAAWSLICSFVSVELAYDFSAVLSPSTYVLWCFWWCSVMIRPEMCGSRASYAYSRGGRVCSLRTADAAKRRCRTAAADPARRAERGRRVSMVADMVRDGWNGEFGWSKVYVEMSVSYRVAVSAVACRETLIS